MPIDRGFPSHVWLPKGNKHSNSEHATDSNCFDKESRLLSKTMASTPAFANALTRSLRSSARTLTAAATRRLLLRSSHRILRLPSNHRKLQLLFHLSPRVLRGSREILIFDEILSRQQANNLTCARSPSVCPTAFRVNPLCFGGPIVYVYDQDTLCMYIYIHNYVCICTYMYIYIVIFFNIWNMSS